jgi:hypothetical protein
VEVETRYRLFHNVEDTLRICTYESQDWWRPRLWNVMCFWGYILIIQSLLLI